MGRPSRVHRRVPGADGQPQAAGRWIHLGRTRPGGRLGSVGQNRGFEEMMRLLVSTAACSLHRIRRHRPRSARRSRRRGTAPRARESAAHRPHRLLGLSGHRRLEVSDGHAEERRLRHADAERRRPESRRHLGPGARRSRRRTVQGVRRAQHHAPAGTPAHHLAGRQHAADRDRRRHPDAAAPFRRHAARRTQLAGTVGRAVGIGGRPRATPGRGT